jgi:hypothetical protein
VWRASVELDGGAAPSVEYKAVLKNGDGSVQWEGGPNSVIDLAGGAPAPVARDFVV